MSNCSTNKMNRTQVLVLLSMVYWLGLTQFVLTQNNDYNDVLEQPDYYERNLNSDENSAETERQEMFELRKLLGKGLVDDVEAKMETETEPVPTQPTTKVKKPSRKIKGPKNNGSEESDESVENQEEDGNESENEYEEDFIDDFVYDPWNDQFQDIFADGTYIYGYALPNGVRRYERSMQSIKGLVVEGFYTEPRYHQQHLVYELRCYRADHTGYRPMAVKYLKRPPTVKRDEAPDVDCFN